MPALISPGDASLSSPYGAAAANVSGMNGAGATGVGMNGAPAAGMAPGFAAPSQPVDPMLARQQHDFDTAMRRAQSDIQRNQLVDALRGLSAWYDHPAVGQRQTELDDLLSQLAGTVVYSREHWLEPAHVVQPGETLRTIADRQQVPWQLLAKINGIDKPESLVAGETLKVVRGPFNAQLNRGLNQLALFVDGLYAGQFAVQTSGDVAQLNGTFPVAKFAADAPSNSLRQDYISLGGNLFLRLADGTATPQTGTMQIQERDLRDVFDILSDRSQVTIRR
jgi:LysM repeat protein